MNGMKPSAKSELFMKWGYAMYRYRKRVLTVWIVFFAGAAILAGQVPGLLKDDGFKPKGSESDRGFHLLQEKLGVPPSSLQLIYDGDGKDLTTEKAKASIAKSLEPLKSLSYVGTWAFVESPRKESARAAEIQAVNVALKLEVEKVLEKYGEIQARLTPPPGMKVYTGGAPALLADMQKASKNDIAKAEMIGLPIALIVLLIIFGTLTAALLPLIVGVASLTAALGITYFIARQVALSNFLPNMVTMLGLAVGIDYALFMVSRFREELRAGREIPDAVAVTCRMAGRSIFFSGIAVLIGLCGMLFVDLSFFRSLCLGGILVVTISVLAANTLLPALLAMLGRHVNSLRVLPKAWSERGTTRRFWERTAYFVMRHPVVLALVLTAALTAMMLPIRGMQLSTPSGDVLPPQYGARQAGDLAGQAFDERELNPLQVLATAPGGRWDAASVGRLRAYIASVKATGGVKGVRSVLDGFPGLSDEQAASVLSEPSLSSPGAGKTGAVRDSVLIRVVPESDPDDRATDALVRSLRGLDRQRLDVHMTGGPAYRLDMLDRIQDKLPVVIMFVLGVTFIVLLLAFRSLLLPLKAVLMNVLSLGASIGAVVLVFQHGFLADLMRVTSTGYVSATVPIVIFCVVFGISMDYEVFLISRIAEEYDRSGDNERSTAEGLMKTGSLITSAAFILIVVVGTFIFTDIEIMKALGLGLALAVLIDATVVRVLLVPALMKLFGRLNWWAPGWLRPHGPREESDPLL
ncbi:MMPL family transporter [Paenibacillus chitinolyticus]|uniref:MMPL family transporter n=1 Tax=Paenibacillus chitinolyticus TaxID=79263 RepID=UPI001C464F8E|nr:MMPL family transporter [Paenibacillus chitinolyticus]MBV6714026.1 MMPL family transporter [Paenibacillus chitinolyticus]